MTVPFYDIIAIVAILAFLVLRFRFGFASRSIVVLAISLFMLAAIVSGLGGATTANDITIVAFYFLATGIMLMSYDHVRSTRGPRMKSGVLDRSLARIRELLNHLRS